MEHGARMMGGFWLKFLDTSGLSWGLLHGVPWSWGAFLCLEPKETLLVPWAHGSHGGASRSWGLTLRDHPWCQLAESHGLLQAALDRAGSGMLRAWLAKLGCFLGFLCYIYSH